MNKLSDKLQSDGADAGLGKVLFCENCEYSNFPEDVNSGAGSCQRSPPQPIPIPYSREGSNPVTWTMGHPVIEADNWCGKHSKYNG